MINITKEQKDFLTEQGVNIGDALKSQNLDKLLEIIDDAIVENIVDNNDEPDCIGIKCSVSMIKCVIKIYKTIKRQGYLI